MWKFSPPHWVLPPWQGMVHLHPARRMGIHVLLSSILRIQWDWTRNVEWGCLGKPSPLMPCFTCPGADSNCSVLVKEVLNTNNTVQDQNSTMLGKSIWEEAQSYCEDLCELNKEGETCSQDSQCTPGALFCDYAANNTKYTDGKCRSCPTNLDECFKEGFATSVQGQHNCWDCRLYCNEVGVSKVLVHRILLVSQLINSATQTLYTTVLGPLYGCSNLILDPKLHALERTEKSAWFNLKNNLQLHFRYPTRWNRVVVWAYLTSLTIMTAHVSFQQWTFDPIHLYSHWRGKESIENQDWSNS